MAAPWWCRVGVCPCLRWGRVLGGSGLTVGCRGLGLGASLLGPTCPLVGFLPWPLWQLFPWGGRLGAPGTRRLGFVCDLWVPPCLQPGWGMVQSQSAHYLLSCIQCQTFLPVHTRMQESKTRTQTHICIQTHTHKQAFTKIIC